jgi:hypothetical protein
MQAFAPPVGLTTQHRQDRTGLQRTWKVRRIEEHPRTGRVIDGGE